MIVLYSVMYEIVISDNAFLNICATPLRPCIKKVHHITFIYAKKFSVLLKMKFCFVISRWMSILKVINTSNITLVLKTFITLTFSLMFSNLRPEKDGHIMCPISFSPESFITQGMLKCCKKIFFWHFDIYLGLKSLVLVLENKHLKLNLSVIWWFLLPKQELWQTKTGNGSIRKNSDDKLLEINLDKDRNISVVLY